MQHSAQDELELCVKQKLGGCNYAVRFYNELEYRLFHYSSAPKLILGKDDYFYENIYLDEYTGKDFSGKDVIVSNVQSFKNLQSELAKRGVTLLLVIEPSKARYLPEYLPQGYHLGNNTNYEHYVRELNRQKVPFLDLHAYFLEQKSRRSYPLFSKHGIHWSTYGMWLAADTLHHFVENQSGIQLPDIILLRDSFSTLNKDLDFDLEPPMNLLCELPHEKLCFPVTRFENPLSEKPQVLIIADSFVWSLWNNGILHHWFDNPEFWNYNHNVYPNIWAPDEVLADKSKLPEIIENKRIVLLMMTIPNLRNFGWNIFDDFNFLYQCDESF